MFSLELSCRSRIGDIMSDVLFKFCVLVIFCTEAFAAADFGKIVEVYSHPNGHMALRLDNGLPSGNEANNCGSLEIRGQGSRRGMPLV